MNLSIRTVIAGLWGAAGVVWLVGALTAKRTARMQSTASRFVHIAFGAAAVVIGFSRFFAFDPLTRPFVPASPFVTDAGVLLTLAGVALAIWARVFLGGNWSSSVTVKENHSLVRHGPYAFVRHPIYTGMLLGILGTALAFREVRVLIAAGLFFITLSLKLRLEERFMAEEFGVEYKDYQKQVKALIPFIY